MKKTTAQPLLIDHVTELRGRFLVSLLVFIIGASIGYFFRTPAIHYLQQPLGEKLYYTTPTGSFEFIMQICATIGLIAALPVLVYNLIRFIEPALTKPLGKGVVAMAVILSFGLAVGGAAFAYYFSLPAALKFFGAVGTKDITALISIDQYFRFVFSYLATFAVIFQLPLLLFLIDHVKPLDPRGMKKIRKFVIVGAFGIALVIPSAPDPMSQLILALPIIVLYEVSIGVIVVRTHGRRRRGYDPTPFVAPIVAAAPLTVAPLPAISPTFARQVEHPRNQPIAGQTLDLRRYRETPKRRPTSSNLIDLRNL